MTDLVDFVRARLDDDEATAAVITPGGFAPAQWRPERSRNGRWVRLHTWLRQNNQAAGTEQRDSEAVVITANERAEWAHIARHDPAAVLAEVEAKRALLATDDTPFCTSGCWRPDQTPKDPDSGWTVVIPHHYDCMAYYIAQVLALPYASHPDYQEEWRP